VTRLSAFAIGFVATMAAFILMWSMFGQVRVAEPVQASQVAAHQR
jgi:hypothetical protein